MQQAVIWVVQSLVQIAQWYFKSTSSLTKVNHTAIATVVYLMYSCIKNPTGAVNHFMIMLIDMVYLYFPATPTEYTIGSMLSQFAADNPYIGWGVVYEIFAGMAGMFGLWCVVKLWQLLPFT